MGIDPVTHKPKNETLLPENHSKNVANLSHKAQWESARLEAEARLVRESKLRSQLQHQFGSNTSVFPSQSSSSSSNQVLNIKEEGEKEWKGYEDSTHLLEFKDLMENSSMAFSSTLQHEMTMINVAEEGFTNLLLDNSNSGDLSLSPESGGECNTCDGSGSGGGSDFNEDNKNYWNNILNLVNSSPSDSSMF